MYSWFGIQCEYKNPFPELSYTEKFEKFKQDLLQSEYLRKKTYSMIEKKLSLEEFEARAAEVKKVADEISAKDMKMDSFIKCRKCGCREIFSYDKQTRSADEGATRFFECTNNKCGFRWRT
jgi:DNA-directed RNA polymerase subunit M/transcription elongation factor TFIIS